MKIETSMNLPISIIFGMFIVNLGFCIAQFYNERINAKSNKRRTSKESRNS